MPKHSHRKDKCQRFISRHIRLHIKEDKMPQKHAVAAALNEARKLGCKIPKK